jgi:hypothetical protein
MSRRRLIMSVRGSASCVAAEKEENTAKSSEEYLTAAPWRDKYKNFTNAREV